MDCPEAELLALSSKPLESLLQDTVQKDVPTNIPETLPFDLSQHPSLVHPLARDTLKRLQADLRNFADMRRASNNPQLCGFLQKDTESIAASPQLRATASARLQHLMGRLQQIKEADMNFVISSLKLAIDAANSADGDTLEEMKFRLLRRCGQELWINFDDLCRQLLSANTTTCSSRLNPFAGEHMMADTSKLTSVALLHCCRVQQVNVLLERLREFRTVLTGPHAPRPASLLQQAERVANDLDARRSYISSDGMYDPRFLYFEFVDRKLLRPRQVDLVRSFLDSLRKGNSAVHQMIMGNGKTTVVSPLLAVILADGSQLVSLLVPPSLLSFGRSVISSAFHGATRLRCISLCCDRATTLDVELASRLQRARDLGDILVTCPSDVKALMLRLVENILLIGDPRIQHSPRLGFRDCHGWQRPLPFARLHLSY
jgi:hypothetical protein